MAVDLGMLKGVIESSAGEWALILSMVFGGCCSNVWALEAVLKDHPGSGTFLTFAQIVYVTIQTLSSQLYFPKRSLTGGKTNALQVQRSWIPTWRKRVVPLRRWMIQVVLFLSVSLINNYVFGLKIPLTVHIIFRSGGLCVSMLTGYWMAGKRYSFGQVLAALMITIGIVLATLSAPRRRGSSTASASTSACTSNSAWGVDNAQYFAGIGLLAFALFLSAWLGLVQERTYELYGKQWREALFYTHFLSLPFFLPLYPTLTSTFQSFALSPPISLLHLPAPSPVLSLLGIGDLGSAIGGKLIEWRALLVPSALVALSVNVITQGLCVRGVNRLTSRVNSVTVNLVLTVRKAVSLAISVWYYGHGVTPGLLLGGSMVLLGTVIYSLAPPPRPLKLESKEESLPEEVLANDIGTTSAIDGEPRGTGAENGIRLRSKPGR